MTTITVEILNEKAINLLKDLELLKLIRLRKDRQDTYVNGANLVEKYKGAMSQQSKTEIDQQLKDIRSEWE